MADATSELIAMVPVLVATKLVSDVAYGASKNTKKMKFHL